MLKLLFAIFQVAIVNDDTFGHGECRRLEYLSFSGGGQKCPTIAAGAGRMRPLPGLLGSVRLRAGSEKDQHGLKDFNRATVQDFSEGLRRWFDVCLVLVSTAVADL